MMVPHEINQISSHFFKLFCFLFLNYLKGAR